MTRQLLFLCLYFIITKACFPFILTISKNYLFFFFLYKNLCKLPTGNKVKTLNVTEFILGQKTKAFIPTRKNNCFQNKSKLLKKK